MNRSLFTSLLSLVISGISFSQENKEEGRVIFSLGASYTGENVNNLSGGIKTGSCYLGMANITLDLNTHHAKLWNNGQFHIMPPIPMELNHPQCLSGITRWLQT